MKQLELAVQLDFSSQTNSRRSPDTTKIAHMFSGFLQVCYRINSYFAMTAREEFFNDPDGFISGLNKLTNRGLRTNGHSVSFEYKPVKSGYLRLAYRYLVSYPGNREFQSKTSDYMNALNFTTGMRL
ncbi:MAG: outer membrane beta-barrel protein [Bacteroidota bacterium]